MVVYVKDIFDTNRIYNSDLKIINAIARALGRKGEKLSFDGMKIEDCCYDSEIIHYTDMLKQRGIIIDLDEDISVKGMGPDNSYDIDIGWFNDENVIMYNEASKRYYWSGDYADKYRKKHEEDLYDLKLDRFLEAVVGYHIANIVTGETSIPLDIELNSNETASSFIHIHIMSARRNSKLLQDKINVILSNVKYDLEYGIFCNDSVFNQKNVLNTVSRKKEIMKEEGFVEGGIYFILEIDNRSNTNRMGYVANSTIVRLDKIGEDSITLASLPLTRTREENFIDFKDNYKDNEKAYFLDQLSGKSNIISREYGLTNMGIDINFWDEDYILVKFSQDEVTNNRVLMINSKLEEIDIKAIDLVYIMLKQYNIDFDEELYKEMYLRGELSLYDTLPYNKEDIISLEKAEKRRVLDLDTDYDNQDYDDWDTYDQKDLGFISEYDDIDEYGEDIMIMELMEDEEEDLL